MNQVVNVYYVKIISKIAEQIVAYLFKKPYPFNVMPEAFWLEQRQSYLEQKKSGVEPRLKQYSQDVKNVINYNEEVQTKNRWLH